MNFVSLIRKDDFRLSIIGKRLRGISAIVPIMSSKGGVGKTVISVSLALSLSELGKSVGLLDLDITNPSAYIVLDADLKEIPGEEKGVIPPLIHNVKFMGISYYTKENPNPLRGWEIDSVLRELLAVTIWGKLDFLIIDTPPGMSDEILDVFAYFRALKPIVIATPSPLALKSVKRLIRLLIDEGFPPLGLIENMSNRPASSIQRLCHTYRITYLGNIPVDLTVDQAIGNLPAFKSTTLYSNVKVIAKKLFGLK